MKALLLVGNSLPSNSASFMMRSTLLIGIIWHQGAGTLYQHVIAGGARLH